MVLTIKYKNYKSITMYDDDGIIEIHLYEIKIYYPEPIINGVINDYTDGIIDETIEYIDNLTQGESND